MANRAATLDGTNSKACWLGKQLDEAGLELEW